VRGNTVSLLRSLVKLRPLPGLHRSSTADYLSPLRRNIFTKFTPNELLKFQERVIFWSKQSIHRQVLARGSNPTCTPATISTIRPVRDTTHGMPSLSVVVL